jgi:hypothetical protein
MSPRGTLVVIFVYPKRGQGARHSRKKGLAGGVGPYEAPWATKQSLQNTKIASLRAQYRAVALLVFLS